MNKQSQKIQSFLMWGVVSICILVIITLQISYDRSSSSLTIKTEFVSKNLIPEELLPYTTFGFTNVIADYYWIRAVQDFSVWDWKNILYLDYFKNISALDPQFEYPYLFAILAVPNNKDVAMLDRVAAISERGISSIDTGWKVPYYLGTQYYLFTKTFSRAEQYLKIATSKAGAPDGAYLIYSSFVAKNIQGSKGSQELIKVIYNNTDNETIKKLAKRGFQEDIISQMLEKGIAAYKSKYKKYPKTVDELIALNFVSLSQEFLESFVITINQSNGNFRVEERR